MFTDPNISIQIECSNHTEMWFKHGLNLNGPLYANLMDKYQMNFIIAAAASGSTLGEIQVCSFQLSQLPYLCKKLCENQLNT